MTTTVVNKRHGVPYDVYIGRPGPYGNPFSHLPNTTAGYRVATREEAIEGYYSYIITKLAQEPDFLEPLRDKVLACWCKPAACHGDVIVEMLGE